MEFNLYQPGRKRKLPKAVVHSKLNEASLYIPSAALANAVNVAISLNMPLLVTGEPGTGKTLLAHHIAWTFGLETHVFNTQTNSVVKDLFYYYDALAHFQSVQIAREPSPPIDIAERFITLRALGKAIVEPQRSVVLIDEIDKAPRDFPNNLLSTLTDLSFSIPETGQHYAVSPEQRPIVILTSNSEKKLPDAFLRRVVYFHIPFPSQDQLRHILEVRTSGFKKDELHVLIEHFKSIRGGIRLSKPPTTAELLAWVTALHAMDFPIYKLQDIISLDAGEKEQLQTSYTILVKSREDMAAITQKLWR